jgi:hypothetical protein
MVPRRQQCQLATPQLLVLTMPRQQPLQPQQPLLLPCRAQHLHRVLHSVAALRQMRLNRFRHPRCWRPA